MPRPVLKQVIEKNRRMLMKIDGVRGVAAATTSQEPYEPCIVVYAATDRWPAGLPRELEGYPVELQRASDFRAL